jgi:hypothetical protein
MGYIPHWRDSTYSVRIRSASTVSMYGALSRETKLFSLITETQLHKSYRIRAQLIFVFFFYYYYYYYVWWEKSSADH